jgi:16S rRNA (uracil1498-N3)-methyltransferase
VKFSHLRRLYISGDLATGSSTSLALVQIHYLVNVLRMQSGDVFRVWNECSGEYLAKLNVTNKKICAAEIMERIRLPQTLPYLCLAQTLIKHDKMTQALDMATQIGATEIYPVVSERCQIHTINSDKIKRCLMEAAEQSERLSLPQLFTPIKLLDFLRNTDFDMIIYANERESNKSNLGSLAEISGKIAVLIGPEGGFTDAELKGLETCANAYSVSLGDTVLRSETAAIALLSQVQLLRKW